MSDNILDDIKALESMCFAIEKKLPILFSSYDETVESRTRLELYNVRCKLASISEFAKQHNVKYMEN
jgi:hypothetical protein